MMILSSGLLCDPVNDDLGSVQVGDIANGLRQLRWCGQSNPAVPIYAHSLAVMRAARFNGESLATQLLALWHDSGEALMGDMRTDLKHHPAMAWFRALEARVTDKLIARHAPGALQGDRAAVKRYDLQALVAELHAGFPQQYVADWLARDVNYSLINVEPLDQECYRIEDDAGSTWLAWHYHLSAELAG